MQVLNFSATKGVVVLDSNGVLNLSIPSSSATHGYERHNDKITVVDKRHVFNYKGASGMLSYKQGNSLQTIVITALDKPEVKGEKSLRFALEPNSVVPSNLSPNKFNNVMDVSLSLTASGGSYTTPQSQAQIHAQAQAHTQAFARAKAGSDPVQVLQQLAGNPAGNPSEPAPRSQKKGCCDVSVTQFDPTKNTSQTVQMSRGQGLSSDMEQRVKLAMDRMLQQPSKPRILGQPVGSDSGQQQVQELQELQQQPLAQQSLARQPLSQQLLSHQEQPYQQSQSQTNNSPAMQRASQIALQAGSGQNPQVRQLNQPQYQVETQTNPNQQFQQFQQPQQQFQQPQQFQQFQQPQQQFQQQQFQQFQQPQQFQQFQQRPQQQQRPPFQQPPIVQGPQNLNQTLATLQKSIAQGFSTAQTPGAVQAMSKLQQALQQIGTPGQVSNGAPSPALQNVQNMMAGMGGGGGGGDMSGGNPPSAEQLMKMADDIMRKAKSV
jgi:hypothetical protein